MLASSSKKFINFGVDLLSQLNPQRSAFKIKPYLVGTVPRARVRLGLEPTDSAQSTSRTRLGRAGAHVFGRWIAIVRPTFARNGAPSISRDAVGSKSDGSASSSSSAPRARVRVCQGMGRGGAQCAVTSVKALNGSLCTQLMHVSAPPSKSPRLPAPVAQRTRESRWTAASSRASAHCSFAFLSYLSSPPSPSVSFHHPEALACTHCACLSSNQPIAFGRHCRAWSSR